MIVALIPLRGGSKSIKKKNIKTIASKPLCAWVLEAACACTVIDEVYVSTDSQEIIEVVGSLGLPINIVNRPEYLATDVASTEDVMLHFAEQIQFEHLVTIQATSPLLTSLDLEGGVSQYQKDNSDSLLSAVRFKHFFWTDDAKPINYDPQYRPRRQDFDGTLMENGAFYITSKDILSKNKCRLGGAIGIYEMSAETAVEIDEPEDWIVVEKSLLNLVSS